MKNPLSEERTATASNSCCVTALPGTNEAPYFRQQAVSRMPCQEIAAANSQEKEDVSHLYDEDQQAKTRSSESELEPDWSFLERGELFGRDEELQTLKRAVSRIMSLPESPKFSVLNSGSKHPELLLVSGHSGCGKTVLVKKLKGLVVDSHDGFFVIGKFDQLQKAAVEPFGPFVAAMTQLVITLERQDHEPHDTRPSMKDLILDQLGLDACQTLCDLVPAMASFLELDENSKQQTRQFSMERQERLASALVKFFQIVSAPPKSTIAFHEGQQEQVQLQPQGNGNLRPIVIVMDDLQWADVASLELVEALVSHAPENPNLGRAFMIVGICRSNEVPWHHSFAGMLRRLEDEKHATIKHVVVKNLSVSATNFLLSKVLRQPPETCMSLSAIMYEKSDKGNVFFLLQLLKTVIREDILLPGDEQWLWHEDRWDQIIASDENGHQYSDVVDLVSRQIRRFPELYQRLLKISASLGAEMEYGILIEVLQDDGLKGIETINETDIDAWIQWATQESLLVEQLPHRPGRFAFAHDQIQQAAYALIPLEEQPMTHLIVGRRLLHQLSSEKLEEHIFLVTNQIIRGIPLLCSEEDKQGVAKLCYRAGKRASQKSDYGAARAYYNIGINLLPQRHWRDEYFLSLELFCSRAEAECHDADFDAIDNTVDEVLANCRSLNDKIRAYEAKIFSLANRSRLDEAVRLGLGVLAELGEKFPSTPRLVHLIPQLLKVKLRLRTMSDENLLDLPDMDLYDRQKLAALSIMSTLATYTFCNDAALFPFLVLRCLNLSLTCGINHMSSLAYGGYAVILLALKDYEGANRFAELSLKLLDLFPRSKSQMQPRVHFSAYGCVFPWNKPMLPTLEKLSHVISAGLEFGDIEIAQVAAHIIVCNGFAGGRSLVWVDQELKKHSSFMLAGGIWHALNTLERENVNHLLGSTENPLVLSVETTNGSSLDQHDLKVYKCTQSGHLLQRAYHLGDIGLALKSARLVRKFTDESLETSAYVVMLYFYDGMAFAEAAQEASCLSRKLYLLSARRTLRNLKKFSKSSPDITLHKVFLLQGELEALKGKLMKALKWYTQAIEHAKAGSVMQLHALAHERAAIALERLGRNSTDANMAAEHSREAIKLYDEWGAATIVAHLKKKIST